MGIQTVMLIGLIVLALGCLLFALLGFLGKNVSINDAYLRAPEEKQKQMNKDAYRIQGSVFFLLLGLSMLCNAFRALTNVPLFTYLALVLCACAIVYYFVSSHKLKQEADRIVVAPTPAISFDELFSRSSEELPSMEKPEGFSPDEAWVTEIQALTTDELRIRYLDFDDDRTPDYRYLCYEELLARQEDTAE